MLKKVSTWNQAWNKVVDLCLIWWRVNEAFNNIMKSSKCLQLENVPLFCHLSDAWISLVYNKYFFFVVKFIISRLIRRYWNQLSRLISFSFQLKFHTSKLIKLIWSRVFFINIWKSWTNELKCWFQWHIMKALEKKSERQNCSAKKNIL